MPPPTDDRRSTKIALAIVAVAFATGMLVGLRDTRSVLYDDAAITMRYAQRIATGHGFTYNSGDRTNGASAPLFTLLLSLARTFSVDLEVAVKAVCLVAYAATFALGARIAHRIAGPAAGSLTIAFLLGAADFRLQALSGMESAFGVALGLGAILLVLEGKDTAAGVVLGLAVFNKLDAGLLAVAIGVALVIAYRRLPWRVLVAAVATFAPWAIFSQLYFGSVLPHSATEKLGHESKGQVLDHTWMLKAVRLDHDLPLLVMAGLAVLGATVLLARHESASAAGLIALLAWPALHMLAFSYLRFGATYPWYKAAMYPPIMIVAAVGLGLAVRAASWTRPAQLVATAVAVVFVLGVMDHKRPELRLTANAIAHGHRLDGYESFEKTRKEGGAYLRQVAAPADVVETCFGWPAYVAEQITIKETCPLNTRKGVGPAHWVADVSFAGQSSNAPDGFHLAARFLSTHRDGGSTDIYVRNAP